MEESHREPASPPSAVFFCGSCGKVAATATLVPTADAAALFSIDPECAPFWCPDCAASCCRDHYQTLDKWDNGFWDCVEGTCPKGHVRVLID